MEPIACHLVFFDAENQVPGTVSYWHWYPREVDPAALDQFYSAFVKQVRPSSIGVVRSGAIYGGIARMSGEWTIVFRFGDGGRNSAGRPGRTVIAAAFVRSSEVQGLDLAGLFRCRQVEELLAEAFVKCPTPKPDHLEFEFEAGTGMADPALLAQVIRDGRVVIQGEDFLRRATGVFSRLPEDRLWFLKLGRDGMNGECAGIHQVMPASRPPLVQPLLPLGFGRSNENLGWKLPKVFRSNFRVIKRHPQVFGLLILMGLAGIIIQIAQQRDPSAMPVERVPETYPKRPPPTSAEGPVTPRGSSDQSPPDSAESAKPTLLDRIQVILANFGFALKWFVIGFATGGGGVWILMKKRTQVRVTETESNGS